MEPGVEEVVKDNQVAVCDPARDRVGKASGGHDVVGPDVSNVCASMLLSIQLASSASSASLCA